MMIDQRYLELSRLMTAMMCILPCFHYYILIFIHIQEYLLQRILSDYKACKASAEILAKGYENALLLVTQAIDMIMTGEGLDDKDLIISKLLRQDIQKYRSLFPHVSAAIQSRRYPLKGETIQYIYTDSKHNNPLCRVMPIEEGREPLPLYDKEKYKEMILDGAETVLGFLVLIGLLTVILS